MEEIVDASEGLCLCVVSLLAIAVLLSDMPSPAATAALHRDAASAAAAVVSDGTAAAASVASARGGRWSRPCDPDDDTEGELDESYETGATDGVFEDLSDKVSKLKAKVTELKNRYVLVRFGNASYAEQSIDLNAPSSVAPNWNLTGATEHETLSRCYENLVRLFVLTNLTYEAESASEEEDDFKDDFLDLLQHEGLGLHLIMCELSIKMTSLGMAELMSNATEAAIDAISFPAVSSKAERHLRDYRVLRLHEMSADNMTNIFDQFADADSS